MLLNGILRGEGNTFTPMVVLVVGAVINIVLDPILIFGLGPVPAMGIKGAAYATMAGRVITALLLYLSLLSRKNIVKLSFKKFSFDLFYIKGIFNVGGATIITRLLNSFGVTIIFVLLKEYGDIAKSAYTLGFSYQQLAFLPMISIGTGVITMTGQNFGAKKYHRLRTIINKAALLCAGTVSIFSVVFIMFSLPLISIFSAGAEKELIDISQSLLIIMSFILPFVGVHFVYISSFQGLGKGVSALILHSAQILLFAIPLCLILSRFMALDGVWLGLALSYIFCAIIGYFWVRTDVRKLEKLIPV